MENLSKFFTCKDLKCPFHPTNHNKGCSLCIAKNLKEGEIPSCFFNKVGNASEMESYYYEDFAKLVLKNKREE